MPGGQTERVDLAHASPFSLGDLHFEPAHRLMRSGDRSVVVQPRVMQLLVAFAQADGAILSRDDLISRCWGGRIVGENAIHRAVSQARKLAESFGSKTYDIESIKGVGYRLRDCHGTKPRLSGLWAVPRTKAMALSRRSAVAAAAASAVAAALGFPLLNDAGEGPSDFALQLFEQAEAARRSRFEGTASEDAVALYLEAVRTAPRFAAAWAGLALAYCDLLEVEESPGLDRLARLAQSAADRALELDASLLNARLAKAVVPTPFRRWHEMRRQLNDLSEGGSSWELLAAQGQLAAEVGHFDEAIAHFRHALEVQPLLPAVHGLLAAAYWATGRLHEADMLLVKGLDRWPRSWLLWNLRFRLLAFEGDTSAAAAHVSDPSRIPFNLSSEAVPKRLQLIRALETKNPDEIAKSTATYLQEARKHVLATGRSALALAALGAADELFDLLRGYYLGVGPFATKITPLTRRPTTYLFYPPLRRFHSDERFAAIPRAIGLAV